MLSELLTGPNVLILGATSGFLGLYLMMTGQSKEVGAISMVCGIVGLLGGYFLF